VLGAASIALTILSSRTAGVSVRRASASLVPGLAIGAAALGAGLAAPAALDALAARLAGDPRNAGAWLDAGRLAAALCAGGVAALLAARRYFPEDWLRLTSPFGQGFLANRMRRLRVGLGSALRSRGD
ncbi:MAG TPA: hypothetical protein VFP98_08265, partial [Candidatus Polarisedimenticolia bacterium]|nr:hypothetical protein [Candidatus Polarisedimenticolia bacterium]